jgi:kelch-like protein 20
MTARFLVNTVSSDLLIRSNQRCRDLINEAKDYLLLPQERLNMQGPRTRRKKPINSSERIDVFAQSVLVPIYFLSFSYSNY